MAETAGLSVTTAALRAGSGDVTKLYSRCGMVGGDAVRALAGMAGNAGHPAMESALSQAATKGSMIYVAAGEVYEHISQGLSGSAGTFDSTEQGITQMVQDWFKK
jgi:hypothetical protein